MFNNVDWKSSRFRFQIRDLRMFEFTEYHISSKFWKEDGRLQFDLLTNYPCIFCKEGKADEVAHVGHINRLQVNREAVLLEISLDDNVPELRNSVMHENKEDLDMVDNEFFQSHWAVKEVDLYKFLFQNARRISVPFQNAHRIPENNNIESPLVSVMMPFNSSFDGVRDSVRQAADSIDLQCKRVDDNYDYSTLIENVTSLIRSSCLVVCDCTGQNPNVLYEIGYADGIGRRFVLITQDRKYVPSNLNHLYYLEYQNTVEGLVELTEKLKKWMITSIKKQQSGTLSVSMPQFP